MEGRFIGERARIRRGNLTFGSIEHERAQYTSQGKRLKCLKRKTMRRRDYLNLFRNEENARDAWIRGVVETERA